MRFAFLACFPARANKIYIYWQCTLKKIKKKYDTEANAMLENLWRWFFPFNW
jgi:hypothetical protein